MIVTNTTIDVITRGLIKYRLITHASANAIGAEMIRLNHLASDATMDVASFYEYERRPFERKVKRAALDAAIIAWQMEIVGFAYSEAPVAALVQRLYDKNLARIQRDDPMYLPSAYGTDVPDTDEGRESVMIRTREEREEENRARLAERMAAIAAERAANPTSSEDEDFDDEDDYDDEDIDPDEY